MRSSFARAVTVRILGYSGADLKIDLDYLRMMTARDRAIGFVWSLYQKGDYREAQSLLLDLQVAYGQRGLIAHGLFPRAIEAALGEKSGDVRLGAPAADGGAWFGRERHGAAGVSVPLGRRQRGAAPGVQHLRKVLQHNGQHRQALACFGEIASLAENWGDGVPSCKRARGA